MAGRGLAPRGAGLHRHAEPKLGSACPTAAADGVRAHSGAIDDGGGRRQGLRRPKILRDFVSVLSKNTLFCVIDPPSHFSVTLQAFENDRRVSRVESAHCRRVLGDRRRPC
jgi:hypothetical protein